MNTNNEHILTYQEQLEAVRAKRSKLLDEGRRLEKLIFDAKLGKRTGNKSQRPEVLDAIAKAIKMGNPHMGYKIESFDVEPGKTGPLGGKYGYSITLKVGNTTAIINVYYAEDGCFIDTGRYV